MFWNLIRWGGTLIVMLAVLAAPFLATWSGDTATPVQPADADMQPKNFNL